MYARLRSTGNLCTGVPHSWLTRPVRDGRLVAARAPNQLKVLAPNPPLGANKTFRLRGCDFPTWEQPGGVRQPGRREAAYDICLWEPCVWVGYYGRGSLSL